MLSLAEVTFVVDSFPSAVLFVVVSLSGSTAGPNVPAPVSMFVHDSDISWNKVKLPFLSWLKEPGKSTCPNLLNKMNETMIMITNKIVSSKIILRILFQPLFRLRIFISSCLFELSRFAPLHPQKTHPRIFVAQESDAESFLAPELYPQNTEKNHLATKF